MGVCVCAALYRTHLQGCLLVDLLCAAKPDFNNKFTVLAQMAPVYFVQYLKQPYLQLGASLYFDQVRLLQRELLQPYNPSSRLAQHWQQ